MADVAMMNLGVGLPGEVPGDCSADHVGQLDEGVFFRVLKLHLLDPFGSVLL